MFHSMQAFCNIFIQIYIKKSATYRNHYYSKTYELYASQIPYITDKSILNIITASYINAILKWTNTITQQEIVQQRRAMKAEIE